MDPLMPGTQPAGKRQLLRIRDGRKCRHSSEPGHRTMERVGDPFALKLMITHFNNDWYLYIHMRILIHMQSNYLGL